MNAVVKPGVVDASLAAELRARLERRGYSRYDLLDRASYDFIDGPELPELHPLLDAVDGGAVGGAVESVRAIRLHPGDYLLTRHDRVYEDRPTELVFDLSAIPVPDAEVHWRHRGQVFFVMASEPGAVAVVERGPTVMSNHTYVSKRQSGVVVRLIVRRSRIHT